MPGPERFQTYTYKENRDKSKHPSQKEPAIVVGEPEDLIGINEKFEYIKNEKDPFKDDAARQNAWMRDMVQFDKPIKDKPRKTEAEIDTQIDTLLQDYFLKGNGYIVNRREGKISKGREEYGIESPDFYHILNRIEKYGILRAGVKSAFDFSRYHIVESEKENKSLDHAIQTGDRLYTNDTLDAVNKIDFVGISKNEDGYLGTINLIQVKSSKPPKDKDELEEWKHLGMISKDSTETIKSIQDAHKDYIKNTKEISELELKNIIKSKYEKESSILEEKYSERLFDLMFYLMEIEQSEKEKDPNVVIEKIVQDVERGVSFSEQDITFLSSMIMYSHEYFYEIIKFICGGKIDFLDVEIFINWINSKVKTTPLQEYIPNNIVSGRKYKSVISYKGTYGWVNIEDDLTN